MVMGISRDLNQIMQLNGATLYQWSFYIDNALDEDIHMPEFNRNC